MSKICLINQPLGLGDILWVQPIVDHYIEEGYEVIFPVGEVYFEMIRSCIEKPGLSWFNENDDFPMKNVMGSTSILRSKDLVYLPLRYADLHNKLPIMVGKYAFAELPLPNDYRNHFEIKRDYDREQKLIDTYGLHGDYIIVNENFATPPASYTRPINVESDIHIHRMDIEQNNANGFNIFDWIGALERAQSIHTVETSFCYIIDKYCKQRNIHVYERRAEGWPRTHHKEVKGVYKSYNWNYED